MTRATLTRVLTLAVFGGILLLLAAKNQGWTLHLPQSKLKAPEDTIYAMLDAARAGDANAYLACYTGHIEESLRQSASESTPAGFAKYLQQSNAAVQGVAIGPPEPVADGQMKLRVEYVYKDRNEVQFIHLRKESSNWKITRIDGAERVKTLVPFGSSVTE
jgi:hypothetical protein